MTTWVIIYEVDLDIITMQVQGEIFRLVDNHTIEVDHVKIELLGGNISKWFVLTPEKEGGF